MNIDPSFGHWFAGFTDGEGSFYIFRNNLSYRCGFALQLRQDDRCILEEIHQKLKIGSLYNIFSSKGNTKPSVRYDVFRKEEAIILRDIFTIFPLRAKKAKDFSLWSLAVDEWVKHENGDSWDRMISIKNQLQESRKWSDL